MVRKTLMGDRPQPSSRSVAISQSRPGLARSLPPSLPPRPGLEQGRARLGSRLLGLGLGLAASLAGQPGLAAERISVSLGILGDSFQVSSLENYAKTGKVAPDLQDYFRLLDPAQEVKLREALNTKADVSVVAVAQFLYSPQGEILLQRLGQVIQSEARQPGFYGIRAALILAAAEPDGLTPLNVVRKFPTRGVRISLGRSWEMAQELNDLIEQTQASVAKVEAQAGVEAAAEITQGIAAIAAQLPNLSLPGPLQWDRQQFLLQDQGRDRELPVDLYLPRLQTGNSAAPPWPTVVISHGLKSDRTAFIYLAEHLASHGFAVIVPEHPGSNQAQYDALLKGLVDEIADPKSFVDRPLDISFILDFFTEEPEFASLMDLTQVGIVGQSFGGYTALSLAGAQLDFAQLRESCQKLNESWNVSLALQCRALAVPLPVQPLQDPRITAVVAINPFTSAVFGETGLASLSVPTLMVSGDLDTIAPALLEQIRPFRWIQREDRRLALMLGGTHFSTIQANSELEEPPLPESFVGRDFATAQRYTRALSLAFLETYLTGRLADQPYLSNSYVKSLNQGRLGLELIQTLP
jgi:predicted dienelactone hydrolase